MVFWFEKMSLPWLASRWWCGGATQLYVMFSWFLSAEAGELSVHLSEVFDEQHPIVAGVNLTETNRVLVGKVDQYLQYTKNLFQAFSDHYFFTEKEIHSYFYSFFVSDRDFMRDYDFNIVHAEYPTPFKCETCAASPFIKVADVRSDRQRGHIDFVVMNPNFMEWATAKGVGYGPIIGIGSGRFNDYIRGFYDVYENFFNDTHERVLLYAVEFKYIRHVYAGTKYPGQELIRDSEKLRLCKEIVNPFNGRRVPFVQTIRSVAFVGPDCPKFENEKADYWNSDFLDIVFKKPKEGNKFAGLHGSRKKT